MKILHTADWHLGKKLDNFSRLDEQKLVLDEICEIAEREAVDAVIVAGDLFDNFNPSAEATELLYRTLHRLSNHGARAVIAIAGNHDSPERIEVPDALARACGIIFVGYPNVEINSFRTQAGVATTKTDKGFIELQLPNIAFPLRLILTPYANELRLKTFLGIEESESNLNLHLQNHWQALAGKYFDNQGINILTTHLFMMKSGGERPEEPEDEKSILHIGGASAVFSSHVPTQTQYVALGHLHRYQVIDRQPCPVVYSSSPLAYSFSEADQTKYVILLHAELNKPLDFQPIALTQGRRLLRKKFDDVSDALAWLADNQAALVQLTMVTETYLEAADKKRLMDAHAYQMPIIPEIRKKKNDTEEKPLLDLETKSMEELFTDYFRNSKEGKGQLPSESVLNLFREVLALEDEKP